MLNFTWQRITELTKIILSAINPRVKEILQTREHLLKALIEAFLLKINWDIIQSCNWRKTEVRMENTSFI
jgi:hypothetical protein